MLCMPEDVDEMEFLPKRTRTVLNQVQLQESWEDPKDDALYQCLAAMMELQDQVVKARHSLMFCDRVVDALKNEVTADAALGRMYRHHKELIKYTLGHCIDRTYTEED